MKDDRLAETIEVPASVGEALEDFNAMFDDCESVLIDRTSELEALAYCVLTRTHLMLQGPHGIAKSMLAAEVFGRIEGASLFTKQFMKTTQPDEIFGPLNAKKYREEAIWEHNTEGYLPAVHFFFGDEIYRASDQALPMMMMALNERMFVNGGVVQKMPLITSIGTTNFTTDTPELEAFHDRWHVHIDMTPLASNNQILKMFQSHLEHEKGPDEDRKTVKLVQIESLNRAVHKVRFEKDVLELALQITNSLPKQLGNLYISDRRKCIALHYAQAAAVMAKRSIAQPEDLSGMRFALTKIRNQQHEAAWMSTYESTVGKFEDSNKERKTISLLETHVTKLEKRFDPSMSVTQANELWKDAKKALGAISSQKPEQAPKTAEGAQQQSRISSRLEAILDSVKDKVNFP